MRPVTIILLKISFIMLLAVIGAALDVYLNIHIESFWHGVLHRLPIIGIGMVLGMSTKES